jgi:hypothetical protein
LYRFIKEKNRELEAIYYLFYSNQTTSQIIFFNGLAKNITINVSLSNNYVGFFNLSPYQILKASTPNLELPAQLKIDMMEISEVDGNEQEYFCINSTLELSYGYGAWFKIKDDRGTKILKTENLEEC